jgi:hypothetical protein
LLQCSSDATLSGPDSEYLPASHANWDGVPLSAMRGVAPGPRPPRWAPHSNPKGRMPSPNVADSSFNLEIQYVWPSYNLCLAKTSLNVDETLSNPAQFLHTLGDASTLSHQAAADDERAVTEEWALSATTRAQTDSRWYRCSQSPTKTPQHTGNQAHQRLNTVFLNTDDVAPPAIRRQRNPSQVARAQRTRPPTCRLPVHPVGYRPSLFTELLACPRPCPVVPENRQPSRNPRSPKGKC